ncbi:coenzyme F420-0:L-glutamate ligase [Candidatus Bipolaricaulota bacterium]|nr:coenzyme F420-0:L-glutamate ligase [Candidatus Bipolaricaulota bacterium]
MANVQSEIRFLPVAVANAICPEDVEHAQIGPYIAGLLHTAGVVVEDHDVIAISSKVASFLDGGLVRLADVLPTRKAKVLAWMFQRDPRKTQLVLEQGKVLLVVPLKRIIRIPALRAMMERRTGNPEAMIRGYQENNAYTFIVRKHAVYLDEAGIDHTNSPGDYVSLLPEDPCSLAKEVREGIRQHFGVNVAVILTDTATSVGRLGSQDVAIGYSGIDPVTRETFDPDLFGVPRSGGIDIVIDSIAGMAGLVMGQTTEKTPIVVVRGLSYQPERADELAGMDVVSWPAESQFQFAWFTLLATIRLWIGNLISLQWRTKKSRIR